MEKIIKALFESSFIFNNKYYVFTCTRDLIEKTNLTGSTIRANIRKLIDLNILIETGYSNTYGLVPYHASTWILYQFNLANPTLEKCIPIPILISRITKHLNQEEEVGD